MSYRTNEFLHILQQLLMYRVLMFVSSWRSSIPVSTYAEVWLISKTKTSFMATSRPVMCCSVEASVILKVLLQRLQILVRVIMVNCWIFEVPLLPNGLIADGLHVHRQLNLYMVWLAYCWLCWNSLIGLSRELGMNASHIKTRTTGTVTHMPPELFKEERLTIASDVYSFGILSKWCTQDPGPTWSLSFT